MLFTQSELASRVREVGADISGRSGGSGPVLLVGLLRGSLPFIADLVRCVPDAEVEFLAISSFIASGSASGESHGRVRIEKDLDVDIGGRHVVVVEDVVDTGFTLSYLMGVLRVREPSQLEVATLLDKTARRIIDVPIAYRGFEIADEFVLGYGLDHQQRYRNLPFVFAADDLDGLVADPDHYMDDALALMAGGDEAQMAAKGR